MASYILNYMVEIEQEFVRNIFRNILIDYYSIEFKYNSNQGFIWLTCKINEQSSTSNKQTEELL